MKSTFRIALIASTIVLAVSCAVFEIFPRQLISLFGSESDLYMEFAQKCMRHFLAGTFLIGAGLTSCIFFQALGCPVRSTIITFLRQVLTLIPAILIFGYTIGLEGVIWSGALSDSLSGIIALIMVAASWKQLFRHEDKTERVTV